jgi:hypothetical protein
MPDFDRRNGHRESAAARATNVDRLMYGEDPETSSPEQADGWIKAYNELLDFKDRLLMDIESGIKSLSEPAGREIRDLDVTLIEIQRKRYRARLIYWEGRKTQLLSQESKSA